MGRESGASVRGVGGRGTGRVGGGREVEEGTESRDRGWLAWSEVMETIRKERTALTR